MTEDHYRLGFSTNNGLNKYVVILSERNALIMMPERMIYAYVKMNALETSSGEIIWRWFLLLKRFLDSTREANLYKTAFSLSLLSV